MTERVRFPWIKPFGKKSSKKGGGDAGQNGQNGQTVQTVQAVQTAHGKPPSVLDLPFREYDQVTKLPATISTGKEVIPPLVSIDETRAHIILLSAFNKLRQEVGEEGYAGACRQAAREYRMWATGLTPLSEEQRKERHGLGKPDLTPLPSLPVIMCWHTHLLNPRLYDYETDKAYPGLKARPFPLIQLAKAISEGRLPAAESERPDLPMHTGQKWDTEQLADAIQRQGKFVKNMEDIGWLQAGRFDTEVMPLQRAIVRYHAWLDLMYAHECKQFLVPTIDLDLAWHTHQLNGVWYKSDTLGLIGQFLNHDDNAGDGPLTNGLEITEKLWQDRYGWNYVY